jgi:hypothetical protein
MLPAFQPVGPITTVAPQAPEGLNGNLVDIQLTRVCFMNNPLGRSIFLGDQW